MKCCMTLSLRLVLVAATVLPAATDDGAPVRNEGKTYALVITGVSKDPQDSISEIGSVAILQKFLSGSVNVEQKNLHVLANSGSGRITDGGKPTGENIRRIMKTLAETIGPQDRLLLFYTGQANVVGESLRLNLPGPDITAKVLAEWLEPMKASQMLIVLDCPGSGLAAQALSGRGRIIVCACEAEQHYSTQFSEYFVPTLQDPAGDSNHDGRISVLEAFTSASRLVDDWYRQRKLLTTETPVLEDDGDGIPGKRPWRYETDGGDGSLAARFFLIPQKR